MLHTTKFKKTIKDLKDYDFNVLKLVNNKKISKDRKITQVQQGIFKNFTCFTLTLVERETCPSYCYHYKTCYGNHMFRSPRMSALDENLLISRLDKEIKILCSQYKGVLIRLHILGDFFSQKYILAWFNWLKKYSNLAIFGFTALLKSSQLGSLLNDIRKNFDKRFSIRFSNQTNVRFSANSINLEKPIKQKSLICPQQLNKNVDCLNCCLCWDQPKRKIIFLDNKKIIGD